MDLFPNREWTCFPIRAKSQYRTILENCEGLDIHTVAPSHVEVCCLLEQLKSAKEHIEITIDAEDYYRIKDSEKK